jgi:hypothetical protein
MEDKKNGSRTLEDLKKELQDKVLTKQQEKNTLGGNQQNGGSSTGGIVPQ